MALTCKPLLFLWILTMLASPSTNAPIYSMAQMDSNMLLDLHSVFQKLTPDQLNVLLSDGSPANLKGGLKMLQSFHIAGITDRLISEAINKPNETWKILQHVQKSLSIELKGTDHPVYETGKKEFPDEAIPPPPKPVETDSLPSSIPVPVPTVDPKVTIVIEYLMKALSEVPSDDLQLLGDVASGGDSKTIEETLNKLRKESARDLTDDLITFASSRATTVVNIVDQLIEDRRKSVETIDKSTEKVEKVESTEKVEKVESTEKVENLAPGIDIDSDKEAVNKDDPETIDKSTEKVEKVKSTKNLVPDIDSDEDGANGNREDASPLLDQTEEGEDGYAVARQNENDGGPVAGQNENHGGTIDGQNKNDGGPDADFYYRTSPPWRNTSPWFTTSTWSPWWDNREVSYPPRHQATGRHLLIFVFLLAFLCVVGYIVVRKRKTISERWPGVYQIVTNIHKYSVI